MASAYLSPFAFTIFLGAFLLFQVQPIIARYILPWFGGSPAVWTTAMLFFQLMLLIGYAYTHWIVGRFSLKRQVILHSCLLCLALATLPITPDANLKPDGDLAPTLEIISLLLLTVGLPYMMLSSTTPLMQSWLTHHNPNKEPYGHYALSNAGSVLGLLLYPFVLEPYLGVNAQTYWWSGAFILFCLVSGWTAFGIYRNTTLNKNSATHSTKLDSVHDETPTEALSSHNNNAVSFRSLFTWFGLAATGVVVLLAATNQLCKDVAVIPLLWILPLVLYLGSFIICFGRPAWYRRTIWTPLLVMTVGAVCYLLNQDYANEEVDLLIQIMIYATTVFACCTVCHGELYRLRPSANKLTLFYLTLSVGGAAGGCFVTLIAPIIFPGYWEFHLCLILSLFISGYFCLRDKSLNLTVIKKLCIITPWLITILFASLYLNKHIQTQRDQSIFAKRNFYGVLRVYDHDTNTRAHLREFYHGRINHGSQFFHPQFRKRPIAYYGKRSGVGLAVTHQRQAKTLKVGHSRLKIGVIGQGVSTMAAHGFAGDLIRFYEIDPDVSAISKNFFTFETDSKADIEVVHGDARISLDREQRSGQTHNYDLLIVDAFSGDGIPIHLLTQEALALYQQHLAQDGIIAFHISNLHFDLRPVVRGLSDDANLHALWIERWGKLKGEDSNDWVIMGRDKGFYDKLTPKAKPWPKENFTPILWTDDYANLFATRWPSD